MIVMSENMLGCFLIYVMFIPLLPYIVLMTINTSKPIAKKSNTIFPKKLIQQFVVSEYTLSLGVIVLKPLQLHVFRAVWATDKAPAQILWTSLFLSSFSHPKHARTGVLSSVYFALCADLYHSQHHTPASYDAFCLEFTSGGGTACPYIVFFFTAHNLSQRRQRKEKQNKGRKMFTKS